mmetsp:Transcript_23793/g.58853  ORF Transcript_23793/g.58853 Transcript_23793/m.58853 type:complete len:287 (+) Transcript_23793:210-1070(+)
MRSDRHRIKTAADKETRRTLMHPQRFHTLPWHQPMGETHLSPSRKRPCDNPPHASPQPTALSPPGGIFASPALRALIHAIRRHHPVEEHVEGVHRDGRQRQQLLAEADPDGRGARTATILQRGKQTREEAVVVTLSVSESPAALVECHPGADDQVDVTAVGAILPPERLVQRELWDAPGRHRKGRYLIHTTHLDHPHIRGVLAHHPRHEHPLALTEGLTHQGVRVYLPARHGKVDAHALAPDECRMLRKLREDSGRLRFNRLVGQRLQLAADLPPEGLLLLRDGRY